jgi:tripartite-type tricarboxylate transporter receptor subunit TctC
MKTLTRRGRHGRHDRLTGAASAALAQDYPERPLMLMVSYGAGGATDFQARIVTMTAGNEDALGMPIAIINKPGAGGRVSAGTGSPRRPKPTAIRWAPTTCRISSPSRSKGGVQYSADSFEPIANWGADPGGVRRGPDSAFNSMEDVVNYAKENPGRLTFSGAGLVRGPSHRGAPA